MKIIDPHPRGQQASSMDRDITTAKINTSVSDYNNNNNK
jgi:hypothetical protein